MALMNNVIILNLKAVFLPEPIIQLDNNTKFLEGSFQKKLENYPYFDPHAVQEIQKMVDATNAEIVISDNWFWTKDFDITEKWCEHNGLSLKFHSDYQTPKAFSSYRVNEIQWWIEGHLDDNVILILDEHYTMSNLRLQAESERKEYGSYLAKYKHYIGDKRRKSLIPFMEYNKYENFSLFYGKEAERTVSLKEESGLTREVIAEAWQIIKKTA
jgi:hypothetical protein